VRNSLGITEASKRLMGGFRSRFPESHGAFSYLRFSLIIIYAIFMDFQHVQLAVDVQRGCLPSSFIERPSADPCASGISV
jgi:hypothetical protein